MPDLSPRERRLARLSRQKLGLPRPEDAARRVFRAVTEGARPTRGLYREVLQIDL